MKDKRIMNIRESMYGYQSEGYSGGKDGLRCSDCDSKYSGESMMGQLCPMCRAEEIVKGERQQVLDEAMAEFGDGGEYTGAEVKAILKEMKK
jgi:hypothetical protein